jgi:hypothetical protein
VAIAEALQSVNGAGVVNFQNDVVNQWSTIWGTAAHQFAGAPGYTYTVTAAATPGNTANAGRFVATADGPEGSHNVVAATVVRAAFPGPPGAVYLASDAPTDSRFYGSAFTIDGNDTNYTGGAGPDAAVPGISTRNAANTADVMGDLAPSQRSLVTGQGYLPGPPVVPSVATSPAAPSDTQMNQFITDLLSRARPPDVIIGNILGPNTWGTPAAPQITHLVGVGGLLTLSGSATGAGILIIEGDLTLLGSFQFDGLVLVTGAVPRRLDPHRPRRHSGQRGHHRRGRPEHHLRLDVDREAGLQRERERGVQVQQPGTRPGESGERWRRTPRPDQGHVAGRLHGARCRRRPVLLSARPFLRSPTRMPPHGEHAPPAETGESARSLGATTGRECLLRNGPAWSRCL